MRSAHRIFAFLLLVASCSYGQMIVLSTPQTDPEVKPEQRTATIVHYEKVRLTARRTIRILALALQNSDSSSKAKLNEAINNEQDIIDSANWCIQALRDNTDGALSCAFPPGLNDGAGSESACQVAENSALRVNCSPQAPAAKPAKLTARQP